MPCNPSERISQGSKGLLIVSYSPKVFWHILTLQTQPLSIGDNCGGKLIYDTHLLATARALLIPWRGCQWHMIFFRCESDEKLDIDIQKLVLPLPMGCEHIWKPNTKCWCICFTPLLKQVRYKNCFATFLGTLFTTCLRHIVHVAKRTQEGQSGKENKSISTISCHLTFI
jgi:hypothetical protein